MNRLLTFIVAMAVLVGCFKTESYTTQIIIKAQVQSENQGSLAPLSGVKAYACVADTVEWGFTSYDDALNGKWTNKTTGEILSPMVSSEPIIVEGLSDCVAMTTENLPELLLLAVDNVNEMYAYSNYTVGLNLPQTYLSLTFLPWRDGTIYKEGSWYYILKAQP